MYTYGTPNGNQYDSKDIDSLLRDVQKLHFLEKVKDAGYSEQQIDSLGPLISRYDWGVFMAEDTKVITHHLAKEVLFPYTHNILVLGDKDSLKGIFDILVEGFKEFITKTKELPYLRIETYTGLNISFIDRAKYSICGIVPQQVLVVV